jgi:hypothetical protein
MVHLSLAEQQHYEQLWQVTVWERLDEGGWKALPSAGPTQRVVISAWKPRGRRLPLTVNQARDVVLHAEHARLGLSPIRARGRSTYHRWVEDGWQIDLDPARTVAVLNR